jgi:predicted nucleic acid-binding protein
MVVDASVTLSWFMERAAAAERARSDLILTRLNTERGIVPALWQSEITNACLVAERRRLVTPAQTSDFLERAAALPIDFDSTNPRAARDAILGLGRVQGLSAYDAAYLELAMRSGAVLATFDSALARAAKSVGVRIL